MSEFKAMFPDAHVDVMCSPFHSYKVFAEGYNSDGVDWEDTRAEAWKAAISKFHSAEGMRDEK